MGISSLHWCSGLAGVSGVGLGPLAPHGVPPQPKYPSINHHTVSVGPALTTCLPLLSVSVWLLYIISYRNSVYLVFRWLSEMVVL